MFVLQGSVMPSCCDSLPLLFRALLLSQQSKQMTVWWGRFWCEVATSGWSLAWVFPRSWPFVENEIEVYIDSKVSKKLYFKGKQQFRLESTRQEDDRPLELKRKGPGFCFGVQEKEEFG